MTENKRYVRILDYSEKEVRIFDENNQKNIFNIFFMGLDSAICLKGALEDTVDLLNELNDKNELLAHNSEEYRKLSIHFEQRNNELISNNTFLEKENEQLKSDNNRLVNETAKIVAEHQRKVLDLIDKRIDKCEPIDYARNIEGDVPVFDCETATEIRVLNELKKELEND